ncbi:MAG: hypothetical protein U0Y68_27355, partial [Blastocatellia bacterium]
MRQLGTIKSMGKLALLLALGVAMAFAGSGAGQQPADLFQQKIAPIFAQNCVGCHGAQIQRSAFD